MGVIQRGTSWRDRTGGGERVVEGWVRGRECGCVGGGGTPRGQLVDVVMVIQ